MSEEKVEVKKETKKEAKGIVLIYPLMKKIPEEIILDPDNEPNIISENVTKTTIHFIDQLSGTLINHGITDSENFRKDIELIRQFLDATIYRSLGVHHPLQDYIDETYEEE